MIKVCHECSAMMRMRNNESLIVTTKPLLKDLYQYVTPQYAAKWRIIGTLLDLTSGALDIIEHDNKKAVACCNDMWKKWLQVDITASWEKLFTVIESPAVSSGQFQVVDKGN